MQSIMDKLVRQHMTYLLSLDNITTELDRFETLNDHMLYYFTSVLKVEANEAIQAINHFLSDRSFSETAEVFR